MIFFGIAFLLLFLYAVIITYYRWAWSRIKSFTSVSETKAGVPVVVTVIIIARNEEENIGRCLDSIVTQTYPRDAYEVVVVNDHSSDGTVAIVKSYGEDHISLLHLADHAGGSTLNSYKKFGIQKAIDVAKGEIIVTTDADCIVPPLWLETIVQFYKMTSSVFIAAPVLYANPLLNDTWSKRFLNIFQSLDFTMLQGVTAASVNSKFHNMCNGANLAYSKAVFNEVNGFEGIDNIASGDDMLLMHKIEKVYPNNIGFLKSKDAIVTTQPANGLTEFFNQRIRWASKADRYPDPKITGVLVLVYTFNLCVLIAGICSFFSLRTFFIFLILLFTKIAVELVFLLPVAKFFNNQQLLWYFIPAQPFHIVYTIVAGWLGKFGSYSWKDRKVK